MNETEVVKKIQAGDMNAFEEIFEIYKNKPLGMHILLQIINSQVKILYKKHL